MGQGMSEYNNAIDDLMEVVQSWVELLSDEFFLDSKNNPWVCLFHLAKLADDLKK